MSIHLTWVDIVLRVTLTIVAGTLFGINRAEYGRPAGMRTTILVCLAASIVMIQVNLLMNTPGKPANSFVTLDLLRFPLGVLTGVGFIGAGAIIRKESFVLGLTSAATLWFVTNVGFCFGGGQILLGTVATVMGLGILWGLKPLERRMRHEYRARVSIAVDPSGPGETEFCRALADAGLKVSFFQMQFSEYGKRREMTCGVAWRAEWNHTPPVIDHYAHYPGVLMLRWHPEA